MNNRTVTKQELASTLQVSRVTLNKWINTDGSEILTKLQATGYHKRQRMFTPKQFKIVALHLGISEEEFQ